MPEQGRDSIASENADERQLPPRYERFFEEDEAAFVIEDDDDSGSPGQAGPPVVGDGAVQSSGE